MSQEQHTAQRVVIVGGGISGLSVAASLAGAGLPVTVLEAGQIGGAASTRNQGWLHSGGVFALQNTALAEQCYHALEQTLRFCPDSYDRKQETMVYLVSRPETGTARVIQAWTAARIPFHEYPLERLFEQLPQLARNEVQHAFQLPDRAIRVDILLEHLAAAAANSGAEIRTGTTVTQLLQENGRVQGVLTGTGEKLLARLVVLAGNAEGAALFPGFGETTGGLQSEYTQVALKAHLLAITPSIGPLPFCVIDAEGFNHIPHGGTSVFGSERWLRVTNLHDSHVSADEIQHLWGYLQRFHPTLRREDSEVVEWAGTTVQAMHFDQIEPGAAPLPTVIDHSHEAPTVENLVSIFPGRASLWTVVAEEARRLVLNKLHLQPRTVASPPWVV